MHSSMAVKRYFDSDGKRMALVIARTWIADGGPDYAARFMPGNGGFAFLVSRNLPFRLRRISLASGLTDK
jgi:hypothetical protein